MRGSLNLGRGNRESGEREAAVDFPAGVRVFDAERPCRRVYLLRHGRVQMSRNREAILGYLGAGDFFGQEVFLAPRQRRQSAKCLTPITVSVFRVSQLLDRLQQDRPFALRLLKNLALRLDLREQMIWDFVTEPAERRLARLLFCLTPGRAATGWRRLRWSPSNSELARTVGTTRSRISHFIGHFRRLGWLQRRPELWVRREGLRGYLERSST